MRIAVPVKVVPDLVEEIELTSDGTSIDSEYLTFVLNEWDEPNRSCNFRTLLGPRGRDRPTAAFAGPPATTTCCASAPPSFAPPEGLTTPLTIPSAPRLALSSMITMERNCSMRSGAPVSSGKTKRPGKQ